MRMDWKSLGYEREYSNGRLRWVPGILKDTSQDQDSPITMDGKPS